MALGPKLTMISAGQALIADTVMQNFQALVDFCRAIPANNLLQSKWSWTANGLLAVGIGAGATTYCGYTRLNFGVSPDQLDMTAVIERALALGGGESVNVAWQKCTPVNGNNPVLADVWTALTNNIQFGPANTVVGVDDILGDPAAKPPYRYAQRALLTGAPALADGDWLRCQVTSIGAGSACTRVECAINLKGVLRS